MEPQTEESVLGKVVDTPEGTGALIGLAAALLDHFHWSFDVITLGVGFVAVGFLLALWGDEWWPDVGRALVLAGGTMLLVQQVFSVVVV